MIDFLTGALLTPGPALIGLVIGILGAWGAWVLLPEAVDRVSIGAWLIGGGYAAGLLWSATTEKKKDE